MLRINNDNNILYLQQLADKKYARKEETKRLEKQIESLENRIPESGEGGTQFVTDETLTLENGVLGVNTANDAEQDNTLPITSAAVYAEIGNINAILATI